MSGSQVEQLAAAVADGDSVDWQSARALLADDAERAIASELQLLSSISTYDTGVDRPTAARLPFVLRIAKAIAVAVCVLGAAAALVTWALDDPARTPVLLYGILVLGGAAAWLDVTGRHDRRALALAGVYWTCASAFAPVPIKTLLQTHLVPFDLTFLQSVRPEAFLPVFLWTFARDFPSITRFGIVDRLSKVGVVAAGCASATLFLANIGGKLVGTAFPLLSRLDRSYEEGRWFWRIVFTSVLAAFAWIVVRGELSDRKERSRVRLFLWTIVAALAPVTLVVLVESVSPAVATFMHKTEAGVLVGALLVYLPLFAFPIATAYVVRTHDVLHIQVVAQRALRYLLTRWILAWGASIPIGILIIVIYAQRTEPLADVLSTPHARLLVWMAACSAALLAVRQPLLRLLDRWMLEAVSDPAATLAELANELRTARTLMELSTLVARAAGRTLHTEAAVYLVEDERVLVCATDGVGTRLRNSLATVLLKGAAGPCVVDPQGGGSYFALLSPDDRRWIQRETIMALCPITPTGSGQLSAMIALKARRNALAFSRSDMQFLTAVCAEAALAHAALEQAADSAPLEEELALQCRACARVDAWRPTAAACECGGVLESAALPVVVAHRFRLVALAGAGGMGVVYRAQDVVLHRHVAVKTLPRLSAQAAERLLEEARAMAALSHPHVAVLYGAEQWRGTPLLIVEYLDGGTLANRLRQRRLPVDAALDIGITLAETLAYMHGTNRSHGDIKPSNIAFSAHGFVKFLDFGLSRALQGEDSDNQLAGGTLGYLSPEVLDGSPPGPASDVWALSVVLFQMLAGYHPFMNERDTVGRIRAGVQDDATLRAEVTPRVADLLRVLLNARQSERPLTAVALQGTLDAFRLEWTHVSQQ